MTSLPPPLLAPVEALSRSKDSAPPANRSWLVVAAAMFCIGWGGNQ
ncbi:MAG: hypothetical protein JWO63_2509, partial [Frankiales bacterium]|nr:hypothetical protein [Frankiales bacterium]